MSSLARRTGSLNLGQGYPDQDGPQRMLDVASAAVLGGRNQYAPGIGVPELRRAVADHQARCYGLDLDPDTQVLVTAGATEAVTAAVLALVDPGDEVVLVEPFYDSYPAAVEMAGGARRTVAMRRTDAGFRLDTAQLREVVTDRTKLMVLNTPHNPTGAVLDAEELAAVAEVALRNDVVVVVDEVYEHLTYDGHRHVPLATLPGMADRTLSVSSAGKTFSCTGWKVGWVTGSPELVRTVLAAKQWLTFTNAAPLQPAVAHALDHEAAYVEALTDRLSSGRDLLVAGLAELGLDPVTPHGSYFTLGDVGGLGWDDAMDFCLALPERAGVVALPAGPFHDPAGDAYPTGRRLVRWAFCKEPEVIAEGLDRLSRADLGA